MKTEPVDSDDINDEDTLSGGETAEGTSGGSGGLRHQCKICHKVLSTKGSLRDHVQLHLEDRITFDCTMCDKSYTSKRSLSAHISAIHQGKMLKCPFADCKRQFVAKKSLDHHLKANHAGIIKFKCEICGKGFIRGDHHEYHMKRHYKIRAYECGICGKKFYTSGELTRHVETCGKGKHVQCTVCDKKFRTKGLMKKHVQVIHQANRTYLCNVCGEECPMDRIRSHKANHKAEMRAKMGK